MDLLERYLSAIKAELPENKQEEIIRELRANLMDEIEYALPENSENLDETKKEQTISNVLRKHGHPLSVAQQFAPKPPLVASEDMSLYKTVLTHSATILFVFALLMGADRLIEQQSINPLTYLFSAMGRFLDNIGLLLIVVTIGFYQLGKWGYLSKWRAKKFDPALLPKSEAQKIKKSDSISEVTSCLFGLMLLWTPLWMSQNSQDSLLFSFTPSMEHWRIIFTIIFAYTFLAAVYRLFQKQWSKTSLGIYIMEYIVYVAGALYLVTEPRLMQIENPAFSELKPILYNVLHHGWWFVAAILGLITISLIRTWLKIK